ncbi:MAG TPA: hypothetical protein VFZ65_15210 [Planctomycetota bacterium]|nr:hypothetical protein [Planctomycetota bacterium]
MPPNSLPELDSDAALAERVAMPCPKPPRAGLLPLLTASLLAQAPVPLPGGTGTLTPAPAWTVLHTAELAASGRDTDPTAEPGATLLRTAITEVQAQQRTEQHVFFHAPGAVPGSLRLVDAFSSAGGAGTDDLVTAARADTIRKVLEPTLAAPGAKVTYLGHADADLYHVPSLVLRFEVARGDVRWQLQHHVVPAGERVQYFETWHLAGDTDAPAAIAALLATFDGAREQPGDPILRNMLIGGGAGALAGVLTALWRRRRLQRAMASHDAAQG